MAKIGIIGSGNVGTNVAFFVAERSIADVALLDIKEGLAKGKSLDMLEAAPIRNYRIKMHPAETVQELHDADILVIALGAVRRPGMTREDLRDENLPVIRELAVQLRHAPGIVIFATEPVDILIPEFVKISCLSPLRVLGLGGVLHSTRLRYLIGQELGISPEDVVTQVIGRNSNSMIPLFSHTSISGIPADILLTKDQQTTITQTLKSSGDQIVELAQRSSSYYTPSAVAADLCEDILKNTGAIRSVSHLIQGAYGVSDVAMSLPVRLGKNGIEQVYVPKLSAEEEKAFIAGAKELKTLAAEV